MSDWLFAPSIPTHSDVSASVAPGDTLGTLNVALTDVNGPPVAKYPDQLLLSDWRDGGATGGETSVTIIVIIASAAACEASRTSTVNELAPAAVGVPVIVPSGERTRPAGRLPATTAHRNEDAPPAAVSAAVYAPPRAAIGSVVELVIRSGGGGTYAACRTFVASVAVRPASVAATEKRSVETCRTLLAAIVTAMRARPAAHGTVRSATTAEPARRWPRKVQREACLTRAVRMTAPPLTGSDDGEALSDSTAGRGFGFGVAAPAGAAARSAASGTAAAASRRPRVEACVARHVTGRMMPCAPALGERSVEDGVGNEAADDPVRHVDHLVDAQVAGHAGERVGLLAVEAVAVAEPCDR